MTVDVIRHIFLCLKSHLIATDQQVIDGEYIRFTTPLLFPRKTKKTRKGLRLKECVAYYCLTKKRGKRVGLRIASQQAIVEYFAHANLMKIIKVFQEEVTLRGEKQALYEAISYCLKQKRTLIIAKLDVISKEVEQLVALKQQLGKLLISCDMPSSDKLTFDIMLRMKQREQLLASLATKAALQEKKQQGIRLGMPQNFTASGRALGLQKLGKQAHHNPHSTRAMSLIARCKQAGM